MGGRRHSTKTTAAVVVGLLLAWQLDLGVTSAAVVQLTAPTKKQSDAIIAYNGALSHFKAILSERRAQISAGRPLPNLPGQALYLARVNMISAYKDLTDAVPSQIGRPNKFKIPPQYFDADNEPLVEEYRNHYNQERPHSALRYLTPAEFAASCELASSADEDLRKELESVIALS